MYTSSGGASPREQLAELGLAARPDDPNGLFVPHDAIRVSPEVELYFSGAYDRLNKNFMLMVRDGDSHILTAACHWGNVAPHLAFRVKDGSWIELYFEK